MPLKLLIPPTHRTGRGDVGCIKQDSIINGCKGRTEDNREGNGLNTACTELETRFRQEVPQSFPGLWLRSHLNQSPRAMRVAGTAPADLK